MSDDLRIEGRLHVNGEAGQASNTGGGGGGSIYINTHHLDGTGSIETTGGNGKGLCFSHFIGFLYVCSQPLTKGSNFRFVLTEKHCGMTN